MAAYSMGQGRPEIRFYARCLGSMDRDWAISSNVFANSEGRRAGNPKHFFPLSMAGSQMQLFARKPKIKSIPYTLLTSITLVPARKHALTEGPGLLANRAKFEVRELQ